MPRTPEQRAAQEALAAAIERCIAVNQMPDGDMVGDWMVIGTSVGIDEEQDPRAAYYLLFSRGSMLEHVALGLLSKAEDLLVNGEMLEEGE